MGKMQGTKVREITFPTLHPPWGGKARYQGLE